jgi:hypothetical protein
VARRNHGLVFPKIGFDLVEARVGGGFDLPIRFLQVSPFYWDLGEFFIQMRARRGQ